MAKLNLRKTIEQGEKIINPYYDLTVENLCEVVRSNKHRGEMVSNAFILGYLQGVKATKAEMKKKRALI